MILVAVFWSLTRDPKVAAGSTAVAAAADGGGDSWGEVGVKPGALAAAVASLADSDSLVSIPSKFCILYQNKTLKLKEVWRIEIEHDLQTWCCTTELVLGVGCWEGGGGLRVGSNRIGCAAAGQLSKTIHEQLTGRM